MAIFKRIKEEHITEDGFAVVSVRTQFLGLPLVEDIYATTNVNVLGCFSPYFEKYSQGQSETNTDYHRTTIGFKNDQTTEVPDELGQTD